MGASFETHDPLQVWVVPLPHILVRIPGPGKYEVALMAGGQEVACATLLAQLAGTAPAGDPPGDRQLAVTGIAAHPAAADSRRSTCPLPRMDIPPSIFFGHTLKPGAVYYYASDDRLGPTRPHYHVVLSASDPDRIVLVYASSKIDLRQRLLTGKHCSHDTLVLASPATEPYLYTQSAFDCNHPVIESLRSLSRKYARRPIRVMGTASPKLLRQLIQGILRSPFVARQYQDLLREGQAEEQGD